MYLQITTRCNMSCEHCCFDCGPIGIDMSHDTVLKALGMAEDVGDTSVIAIGGGEPTLHQMFWEILGLCMSRIDAGGVWLATNGSRKRDALKLAELARAGIIGCALSQDWFHGPINQAVIDAFTRDTVQNISGMYGRENDLDRREIRCVNCDVLGVGRALKNMVFDKEDECVCDDLFVSPDGRVWSCGCQKECFGTVDNYEIPDEYWQRDEKCWNSKLEEAA